MAHPRDTDLRVVARALAGARQSSVVIVEITHEGSHVSCTDAGALRENDGEELVLVALVHALHALLVNTEASLAVVQARNAVRSTEPPS